MNFYPLAHVVLFPSLRLRAHGELHAESSNLHTAMAKGLLFSLMHFLPNTAFSSGEGAYSLFPAKKHVCFFRVVTQLD